MSESKILFLDDSNNNIVQSKKVFNNYYGYVYLSIEYAKNNETYRVYSDWLDIYIKNDDTSDLIKPMVEYIYNNSSKYLYKENSNVLDYSSTTKSKNKNMYTKISLLEKIVLIYTENLKFFKNYVHYENIEKNIIDDFEKLNIIKGDTIQFILSNPQYLKQTQSITGIKYNKTNLIPIKTLINKNEISKNIYENKIVLGFLKSIYLVINDEINILSKTRVDNIKDKYNEVVKRHIAIEIILNMLIGKSSNLYNELYKEGYLLSQPDLEYEFGNEYSHVLIGGQSKNPQKVYEKIAEKIQEMKNNDINVREFERIKKKIYGDYAVEYNNVADIGRMFTSDYIKGINSFEYMDKFEEIDAEYAKQVLKEIFTEDKMIMSVIKGKK